MKLFLHFLTIAVLVLTSTGLYAQKSLTKNPRAKEPTQRTNAGTFYKLLDFTGGAYADNKNADCEPGFIGWYQESQEEDPILIVPNDAFRNVRLKCNSEDLKAEDVSCLERNTIRRFHTINGTPYVLTLKMAQKSGTPIFQIRRQLGKKVLRSCQYSPVQN